MKVNHSFWKNAYSAKKGSAAIILSLIVSGSVLSTIFISQKSTDWFLSFKDHSSEDWEYNFVGQTALAVGGYLISNNLILCKEAGWKNSDALCKWNDKDPEMTSSIFFLEEKILTDDNGKSMLSYKGKIEKEIINNLVSDAKDIEYQITFDLVNWKDTNIQNLIGDIPTSACRDATTMQLRTGKCESPKEKICKDESDADIPGSVCEYMSNMDQDYTIVLMSITTPLEKTNTHQRIMYAGARRPLAMPLIMISKEPICRTTCPSNNVATSLPECRGEFVPPNNDNVSDIIVEIINPGPGAVYALSLLRTDKFLVDDYVEYRTTGELLEDHNKEVLLPNEAFTFQDQINCQDSLKYNFRQSTTKNQSAAGVYEDINVHIEDFLKLTYGLSSLKEPIGACMAPDDTLNAGMKFIPGDPSCPTKYSDEGLVNCGQGGKCYYSHIEPRRTVAIDATKEIQKKETVLLTIIVRYVPPH